VDDDLLAHYVARGAEAWNVSTEAAWLDFELRAWVEPRLAGVRRVCNVGIGVGLWDDWLGHVVRERITSVDRDPDICRVFALRQARERHPFPAEVVCGDVLEGALRGRAFDAITAVGSTAGESGEHYAFEAALLAALAPGGVLLLGEVLRAGQAAPAEADLRGFRGLRLALCARQ
jgi:protein-L-isoaspartate O-methyltransferase